MATLDRPAQDATLTLSRVEGADQDEISDSGGHSGGDHSADQPVLDVLGVGFGPASSMSQWVISRPSSAKAGIRRRQPAHNQHEASSRLLSTNYWRAKWRRRPMRAL